MLSSSTLRAGWGGGLLPNPKSREQCFRDATWRACDGLPEIAAAQWVRARPPESQWELPEGFCHLAGGTQRCGSTCTSQKKTRASQKGGHAHFPGVTVKGAAHKGA